MGLDRARRDAERLFADITAAGFDLLTWRKGPAPDLPADAFTTITCTDDRGRAHEYDLADTTAELGISEGPRKGQTVTLRQVTRRVPARAGGTRQIHALTSRTDLPAGEVCWRLSSRWREENYFRYARTRFALDALDSYAAAPDDPDRMVPNPARKTAAARVRQAEAAAQAAEAARDAALLQLRSPAPGQAAYLTNQVINALNAPVQDAWRELGEAEQAAAAIPARIPLGTLAPDMVRLDAETKQITHAIRMAAYNAETALARALDGHYARAGDEAYALIREALTASGDIRPSDGQLLIRLDPLTAPRRTQALAALCDQLNQAQACYPGTDLVLRYEVKPHPGAARLKLDPRTDICVVLRHVRYIDGKPAIISDDYFEEKIVEGTELAEPKDTTRENILAEAGYEQVYDIDEIITRMPTSDEIARLGIPPGTPVAEHIRTGYTADNKSVRLMISIVPGDTLILQYTVPT